LIPQLNPGRVIMSRPPVPYYPETLLVTARKLIDAGEHSVAVIVSHMACEIAADGAMSRAYKAKGVPELEDAVDDFLTGHNPGNHRDLKLYNALTGKRVQDEAWWSSFKSASDLRNDIVHGAKQATQQQAEDAHKAAAALVAYRK